MDRQVNIGMIGAGFIGQLAHLMNYVEAKRCRVLGLAEYRPELRLRVAQRYDIPRAYATHTELIADPDIDAVVVVTPRPFTARIVADCLAAGKHVLSEKPMAGTSFDAQPLVDLAREKSRHYIVGYMKRHDEGVQQAKALLTDAITTGKLGKVVYARAHCYMGDSYCKADGHVVTDEKADYPDDGADMAPAWMPDDWRKLFAAYVNTYSHNVNLLRYLFDRTPTVVHAQVGSPNGHLAVLDFGDFRAALETGRTSNRGWDEVTEIFFEDGRITLRTPPALLKNVPATVELYHAGAVQQTIAPQCNWTWAFRRQAQAFVDAILDNSPSTCTGADGIEDLKLIEAIWWSEALRQNLIQ